MKLIVVIASSPRYLLRASTTEPTIATSSNIETISNGKV
jgi:hypothetical protein